MLIFFLSWAYLLYDNARSIWRMSVDDSNSVIEHLTEIFASRSRMQGLNSFSMIRTIKVENVVHWTRNESWKVFRRLLHWKQYLETLIQRMQMIFVKICNFSRIASEQIVDKRRNNINNRAGVLASLSGGKNKTFILHTWAYFLNMLNQVNRGEMHLLPGGKLY